MRKQLMKGNDALMKSAILAGCRAFYGYPITPARWDPLESTCRHASLSIL